VAWSHSDEDETYADEEGRFWIPGLENGANYTLRVKTRQGRSAEIGPVRFDDEGRTPEYVIRLPPPSLILTGRVLDGTGAGVADAAVRLGEGYATTTEDGTFRLETWPCDSELLYGSAGSPPGVVEGLGTLAPGEHDVGNLRLVTGPGVRVSGRVRDGAGQPLSGVVVVAGFQLPGEIEYVSEAVTDGQGRYEVAGPVLEGCTVHLEVECEGHWPAHREVRAEPKAVVDIDLKAEAAVIGRVTFSGDVPQDIDVEAAQDDSTVWMYSTWDPVLQQWRGRLPPGTYELWIGAAGYAPRMCGRFEARTGATHKAPDAHLTEGGTVEGFVLDVDGVGREGGRLSIRYRKHRILLATTQEGGAFRFRFVPPGRYPITARMGRLTSRGEVTVEEGRTTVLELRLK
jgi:hypothetical protein